MNMKTATAAVLTVVGVTAAQVLAPTPAAAATETLGVSAAGPLDGFV